MAILATVVIVFGFLWFMLQGKKEERRIERAEDLDNWTYIDTSLEFAHISYRVYFPSMGMQIRTSSMDGPGVDTKRDYVIRKRPNGDWEARLSDESYSAELKQLQAFIDDTILRADDDMKARFERMKQGNNWEPIRADIASMIDTAHQRHIHQAR